LDWLRHGSPRLGAALAYYAVFSLGPLLLIVIAVAGLAFGEDAVRGSLSAQFHGLLGDTGGQAIDAMIKGASSASSGKTMAGIGIVLLIVAAVGVVVQMKDALNTIWEVDQSQEAGLWGYVRTYVISLATILALGFLLAVSLVISTGLAALTSYFGLTAEKSFFWQAVEFIVSTAILTLLFALLLKFFPDTKVEWNDVWLGAIATAVLFQVGKLAISWYIGTQGLESTYGAAASVVVLLIWVYYSSQIVLFGAELSHVRAQQRRTVLS
jgi:membrane protein